MKRFFGSGLFAAALVTLPAFAQTSGPVPLPQWFVEIDIGKKGEVTRAEFLKYRIKSFKELDVNNGGTLSGVLGTVNGPVKLASGGTISPGDPSNAFGIGNLGVGDLT